MRAMTKKYDMVDWTKKGKRCAADEGDGWEVTSFDYEVVIKNLHDYLDSYADEYPGGNVWDALLQIASDIDYEAGNADFSNDLRGKIAALNLPEEMLSDEVSDGDISAVPAIQFEFHVRTHDGQWWIEA